MPCYLFTFHAFGTWMPDRGEGFVRREQGLLPADDALAAVYRDRAKEDVVVLQADHQIILIDEERRAFAAQGCRGHYVATDPTHIHILVSWTDVRPWLTIRNGLKSSLTRRLNRDIRRRDKWFVENASRRRVRDHEHFDHLVSRYLPSHRGWKWCEGGEPFP